MAGLIEAIDIKRKMYFEYENAPYHCLDVEISRPTARGGQMSAANAHAVVDEHALDEAARLRLDLDLGERLDLAGRDDRTRDVAALDFVIFDGSTAAFYTSGPKRRRPRSRRRRRCNGSENPTPAPAAGLGSADIRKPLFLGTLSAVQPLYDARAEKCSASYGEVTCEEAKVSKPEGYLGADGASFAVVTACRGFGRGDEVETAKNHSTHGPIVGS